MGNLQLIASFIVFLVQTFESAPTAAPTLPLWVDNVHLIMSNHLDMGFTDYAVNVVNKYFDNYFPLAFNTAKEVETSLNKTYKWLTQSWLVSMFLDCPPNMGLHCPNSTQIKSFLDAVNAGYIYWHSFPFNSEMSAYDRSLIDFGIKMSRDYGKKYNGFVDPILSQRDVPGITRSIIPILVRHNITALSIGANGGSAPPDVPSIFKWNDPESNQTIIGMMHGGGYGGIQLQDAVILPGFNHALVMAWNSDNQGPPGLKESEQWYNVCAQNFPTAAKTPNGIFASTFSNFLNELYSQPDVLNKLPIIDTEMGDTWNYGIASDPYKAAAARSAQRMRADCVSGRDKSCSSCTLNEFAMYNFSRLLLKNYEHTWGGSISHFLNASDKNGSFYYWSNQQFHQALNNGNNTGLITLKAMWDEQRSWGLDYALQALSLSTNNGCLNLYNKIKKEWNHLLTVKSPLDRPNNDWNLVSNKNEIFNVESSYTGNKYQVQFNGGFISDLYDVNNNINYTSNTNDNVFAKLIYQTLTEIDFNNYVQHYGDDGRYYDDMGKPGLDQDANPKHQYIPATFDKLWQSSNDPNRFLIGLNFGSNQEYLKEMYGIPSYIYNEINFNTSVGTFSMDVIWINKTASRMPEVYYLKFNPINCNSWRIEKLNQMINISDVMMNGTFHTHSFTKNITCKFNKNNFNGNIEMRSSDSPVAVFKPKYSNTSSYFYNQFTPFCTPFVDASQDDGMAFVLYNNAWGTNYPSWYPFDPKEINSTFRFDVQLPQ